MGEEADTQPDLQTTDSSISGSWPTVAVKRSLGLFPVRNVDGGHYDQDQAGHQSGLWTHYVAPFSPVPSKGCIVPSSGALRTLESLFSGVRGIEILGSCASPCNLSHWAR
jgi:hypothetical protein